jgi:anti-sigma B factor antagonist
MFSREFVTCRLKRPSSFAPESEQANGAVWTEEADDQLLTIRLTGEIDLQHSPRLRRLLQQKARQKAPLILLDFQGVKYIDSSGLATLVEYFKISRGYSGRVAIAGLSERVRSIFDLVRLGEVFPLFPSEVEARAALAQS